MNDRLCVFCLTICLVPLVVCAQDAPPPGKQVEQTFKTSDGADVGYLLYLPKNFEHDGEKMPMVLFLHGRGESNGPLSLVAKWGPPRFAQNGDELPYVLVSPQCPKEDFWSSETQQQRITELVDAIVEKYAVDQNRLYLTGLSMGGFGSWRMAADQPKRFAAVAPVCGRGDAADGEKLKDIPIWVFHGNDDRVVPYQNSVDMVQAIKQAGGTKVRFTSLEHIGHNSWSSAYATPELYQWMLDQKLSSE
ncbi:MAG: prolyl oligopeptidase family serine peptidase [Pirellulaceae bacterium]|nr:prolyl oligopeptidase family serine peptidase [Pirellulaceae bacterium]